MQNTIKILVDLKKEIYRFDQAQQGDDVILDITLLENGVAKDLTGETVELIYINANNTIASVTGDKVVVSGNNVKITCPRDCTRSYGIAKFQLKIVSTYQVSTFPIALTIVPSVDQNQQISQNISTILEDLTAKNIECGETLDSLKSWISTGNLLNADLEGNIGTGTLLNTDLEDNITTVTQLQTVLSNTINTGNEVDTSLEEKINIGNTLDVALKADTETANTAKENLQNVIATADTTTYATQGQVTEINSQLADIPNQSYITEKATKSYVDTVTQSLANGSPKGTFATLLDLQTAYPTGTTGIYVVTADGNWYYWNGSAWTPGGIYQATQSSEFPATNIVQNGNFINTTGWTGSYVNISTINNEIICTIATIDYRTGITQNASIINGHKYYIACDIYALYSNQTYFNIGTTQGKNFYPTANEWFSIKEIISPTTDGTYFRIRHTTSTPSTYSVDNTFKLRKFMLIDLTSTFGVGNEPTISNFEYMLSRFTNSYFDGTVSPFIDNKELFKSLSAKAGTDVYTKFDSINGKSYPFQDNATLSTDSTLAQQLKNAIKDVKLFGADKSKQYSIVSIYRNNSNTWRIEIWEVNGVTLVSAVAWFNAVSYTEPTGIDELFLIQRNASGITGKVLIDWKSLDNNFAISSGNYNQRGLSIKTYTDLSKQYLDIVLPPTIYAVIGKEVNIYYENVIMCDNLSNYQVYIGCEVGKSQNERWTFIPTVSGTYLLTINIYKEGKVLIATATTSVVVKPDSVGNGVNKTALVLGDSTVNAGVTTSELLNLFNSDVMDVTLLGTLGEGLNRHEGRSGWSANDYNNLTTFNGFTNPFLNNGVFDFSYYMTQQGYTSLDYFFLNLGINDTSETSFDSVMVDFQKIVDSVKAYDYNIKVCINITIPPSYTQDSMTGNSHAFERRVLQFNMAKKIIKYFSGKESQGIYLVPINVNLDTVHNMQTISVPVNSRNSLLITRQSNNVHPADSGYYQIADTLYYFLKSFEI